MLSRISLGFRLVHNHDNASSHTSDQTTAFLSTENIDLMSYPLYSTDLVPNDFFLSPYVKNKTIGQRFSKPEEAVDAFRMDHPQSEWQKCFDNWFKLMQKCIEF